MIDLLDLIDLGTQRRLVGRAVATIVALAGCLLITGWSRHWPVAYDLVQHVLDARARRAAKTDVPER